MRISYLLPALGMLLAGCAADDIAMGEGRVVLSVGLNSDVHASRSQDDLQQLARKARVDIYGSRGLVRRYEGLGQMPADGVALLSGHYTATAAAGDSVPASWETRYFTGSASFEVEPGGKSHVNVPCPIANVAATVEYAPEVTSDVASDLVMTVGTAAGSLAWERGDNRRGYFMLPSASSSLTWRLTGTGRDGRPMERSGVIDRPKRATEYALRVSYGGAPLGHAEFTVTVDEHALEMHDQVVISMPPEIAGVDFDLEQPVSGNVGSFGPRLVMASASSAITRATVTGASIGTVDLMAEGGDLKGLQSVCQYDPDLDVSKLMIAFPDQMLNALPEGTHSYVISVTDANHYTVSSTLTIVASALPVLTADVPWQDVWATHAMLRATVVRPDTQGLGFRYRRAGAGEWSSVQGQISGTVMTAEVRDLQPGTTYEYAAVAGSEADVSKTFTTEEATQLPNAGFERWQTSSTPYLIYGEGDQIYWDSGNHGSATLRKNVTTPDAEVKHSGQYSARLSSQFVGVATLGKFAAGNLFTGRYLATIGTDGVLGWGRPFSSRPRALKGYIRYEPQPIAYGNADCPDPSLAVGNLDQGIVYVALLTDHTEQYKDFTFPVIVKTRPAERQLFDPEGSNVVAYGQQTWTQSTQGQGMVEFEIPLDYRLEGVRVANIMVVAAASRGGDYFVGGPSTMWLDDLELVY